MKSIFSYLSLSLAGIAALVSSTANAQYRHHSYNHYDRYPVRSERVVYEDFHRRPVYYPTVYARPVYRPVVYRPGVFVDVGIVTPTVGIHVGTLPFGYRSIWLGPEPFFYYQGTFYRRADRDYEVVNAPVGAEVPDLPARAKAVVINNSKYYELDGTYYKENIHSNGEIWYTVVGKDGQITYQPAPAPAPQTPSVSSMQTTLPQGCKVVVLNGQKYYVSPDGTYYQEVIDSNSQVFYKVIPQNGNQ